MLHGNDGTYVYSTYILVILPSTPTGKEDVTKKFGHHSQIVKRYNLSVKCIKCLYNGNEFVKMRSFQYARVKKVLSPQFSGSELEENGKYRWNIM